MTDHVLRSDQKTLGRDLHIERFLDMFSAGEADMLCAGLNPEMFFLVTSGNQT
jgi:hypothetical protein